MLSLFRRHHRIARPIPQIIMLQVLIVDDDSVVIFIQKKMVCRHDIARDPLSFKRAKDALDFLFNQSSQKDSFLILLDINMPEMNGWKFLREIEKHPVKNRVYVVMVTSSIDLKDKEEASCFSEVVGFVEKPISNSDCENIKKLPEIASFFQDQD